MARKKSRRSKPAPKKVQKLETCFDCPFCGHPGTVACTVDLKNRIAEATCGTCKESYATAANALTEPIDVYCEWIDACEQANDGFVDLRRRGHAEFDDDGGF